MAPSQCVVLVLVVASVVSSQTLPANVGQLEKLSAALSKWKRISAGKPGYVVRHQQLMNYVDLASGEVRKNVCVPPTQPPTITPSLPVRIVHKVEEMFALLEKALHDNFCKLVRIRFSKNNAYPVIAKMSGCKDPAMDAVIELGEILLTPKKHSSRKSLCEFVEKNSNLLDSDSDDRVEFAHSLQSWAAVLPKDTVHAQISAAVSKAKAALSKSKKTVQEKVQAATKGKVLAPFKPQTKKLSSTVAKSTGALVKKLQTGMARQQMPDIVGKIKQAMKTNTLGKDALAGLRDLSTSATRKDLLKVKSELTKKLASPSHPKGHKTVVPHKPVKHQDEVNPVHEPEEPFFYSERGYGNPEKKQPARNSGLHTSSDVYEKLRGRNVEDHIVYISGKKLEKIVDSNHVYIMFDGKVIHDGVLPAQGDSLSTVEKGGHLLILYNREVIYDGNMDHGRYEYYHHVRKILFFTGCALLGIAMVMIVGRSFIQACKPRKSIMGHLKAGGSVTYTPLGESAVTLDDAPAYKDNGAHVVSSPEVQLV